MATNDATQRVGTKEVRSFEITFTAFTVCMVVSLFAGMYFGFEGAGKKAEAAPAAVTAKAVPASPKK